MRRISKEEKPEKAERSPQKGAKTTAGAHP